MGHVSDREEIKEGGKKITGGILWATGSWWRDWLVLVLLRGRQLFC
jgi:hypothetical protein